MCSKGVANPEEVPDRATQKPNTTFSSFYVSDAAPSLLRPLYLTIVFSRARKRSGVRRVHTMLGALSLELPQSQLAGNEASRRVAQKRSVQIRQAEVGGNPFDPKVSRIFG